MPQFSPSMTRVPAPPPAASAALPIAKAVPTYRTPQPIVNLARTSTSVATSVEGQESIVDQVFDDDAPAWWGRRSGTVTQVRWSGA